MSGGKTCTKFQICCQIQVAKYVNSFQEANKNHEYMNVCNFVSNFSYFIKDSFPVNQFRAHFEYRGYFV